MNDYQKFVYHIKKTREHLALTVHYIRQYELRTGEPSHFRERLPMPFETCERIADNPDLPISELVLLLQPMFERAADDEVLSATEISDGTETD